MRLLLVEYLLPDSTHGAAFLCEGLTTELSLLFLQAGPVRLAAKRDIGLDQGPGISLGNQTFLLKGLQDPNIVGVVVQWRVLMRPS